jgi:hypothetical protein
MFCENLQRYSGGAGHSEISVSLSVCGEDVNMAVIQAMSLIEEQAF